MGIRGVRIDGDDLAGIDQAQLGHPALGEVAQVPLGGRLARTHAPRGLVRRLLLHLRDELRGTRLRLQALRREHALDLRHQLGAGGDLGAQ